MIRLAICILAFSLAMPAVAQPSPYAGQEMRQIKALAPEDIADLLAGRGMGLALAAELNAYPGPAHALELAAALELTRKQTARLEDIKDRMTADAMRLGRQLVEAERELDGLFASARITDAVLQEKTEAIGLLQGRLRAVHLATHIETRSVLTPRQVQRYDELRGYRQGSGSGGHRPGAGHPHRH